MFHVPQLGEHETFTLSCEVKNKREKLRLLLRRKKNFFFYVYDVHGKNKKKALLTTTPSLTHSIPPPSLKDDCGQA
jgi:hypothetical protein